jgi:thiosulfate reductase cytochrome b subunit
MKRVYLHPLPLRVWHWMNALLVILLLATGTQFRLPGIAALWPHSPSLALHKWMGIAMTVSWIFWLIYGLATGHVARHYALRRQDLVGIPDMIRFYTMSIFRGENSPFRPSPEAKYHALQRLAYVSIMGIVAPLMVATGLFFVSGFRIGGKLLSFDTMKTIDTLHVTGLYLFALFLVTHIYMATTGQTFFSHIRAMITGYEEEPDEPGEEPKKPAPETGPPTHTEKTYLQGPSS